MAGKETETLEDFCRNGMQVPGGQPQLSALESAWLPGDTSALVLVFRNSLEEPASALLGRNEAFLVVRFGQWQIPVTQCGGSTRGLAV